LFIKIKYVLNKRK